MQHLRLKELKRRHILLRRSRGTLEALLNTSKPVKYGPAHRGVPEGVQHRWRQTARQGTRHRPPPCCTGCYRRPSAPLDW
ncbi:UNVERIFIED_CONTAM: hypothetical protein K2H54_060129 [Gekko kuhli]